MTDVNKRFAPIGGLRAYNFNPLTGEMVHGPTGAIFKLTAAGLSLMNRAMIPEEHAELLTAGAVETARREAERDPFISYTWVDRYGRGFVARK
jgi:hypothetical protein